MHLIPYVYIFLMPLYLLAFASIIILLQEMEKFVKSVQYMTCPVLHALY